MEDQVNTISTPRFTCIHNQLIVHSASVITAKLSKSVIVEGKRTGVCVREKESMCACIGRVHTSPVSFCTECLNNYNYLKKKKMI